MINHIFILVPSFIPTGPVKGAVALANALVSSKLVTLVSLKGGDGFNATVNENVELIDLSMHRSFIKRLSKYRKMLHLAGNKNSVASISFAFSADMTNIFCNKYAITCSSVRGNLQNNYKMEYGWLGKYLAFVHLSSLRFFNHVIVMTDSMREHVFAYTSKMPAKVSNFIDQPSLAKYRRHPKNTSIVNFIFVGSLTERKQPLLLVESFNKIVKEGHNVHLDIIGSGRLESDVLDLIEFYNLQSHVNMHGHLNNPYPLLSAADIFVLPSLSEGLSRASLEALYLGLPCIMRDVDGNSELIMNGINGYLFITDEELVVRMKQAIKSYSEMKNTKNLLPKSCDQDYASQQYLSIIERT